MSLVLKETTSKLLATSTNNQLSVRSATSHAHLSPSNSIDISNSSASKVLLKQDSTVSCSSVQSQADRVLAQLGGGSPRLGGGKRSIRQLLHQDSSRSFRSVQSGDAHFCPVSKDSCSHDSTNNSANPTSQSSYSVAGDQTPLDVIAASAPAQLIDLMLRSISLHKEESDRGKRSCCSPAVRWKTCSQHCVSILCARVVAVSCHAAIGQRRIASDSALLRQLVEALDPNRDPVSLPQIAAYHAPVIKCLHSNVLRVFF